MTTRANYGQQMAGIPWSSLSGTIQDALTATRELGCRCIWIDSLCIIQHDRDDWVREGSRMQEIFENCSVAIATPAASNAQSGFLRPPSSAVLMECPLPGKNEGIVLAVPTAALDVEYDGTSPAKSIEALERSRPFTRGWVLQERLLPLRILYFGTQELYFECRTCSLRESYWVPANGSPENIHGVQNKDMNEISGEAGENDQLSKWLFFVAEYTALGLTNWSDRLPAISGLGRKFASKIRGEYVAGLWNNQDLYRQLMWRDCRRLGDERSGFDSSIYVAPSWSWASSWGRVLFLVTGKHEILAEIESCHATRATRDLYGQVQSGALKIKGRVQTFVLRARRQKTLPEYTFYKPGKPGEVAGICLFDRDEVSSPEGGLESNTIDLVVLGRQGRGFRSEYSGLALEAVSRNPLLYRRVGYFSQGLREQDYWTMWSYVESLRITIV